ncbi:MAG: recombination mediator RecR [Candidatus Gracilibacteria bacterium]|nr:recombination mediator RecR [Candidatus Gracilibacteria bacterium]
MPEVLKKLIDNISLLPGIGDKTATKLAFFLLNTKGNYIDELKNNLSDIKTKISKCSICGSLTNIEDDICSVCSSYNREKNVICIVEEYLDLLTIEQTGGYNGVYHVLGGAISPINGIFASDLNINKLIERIEDSDGTVELIIATNPNIEGEATSAYIKEEIGRKGLSYKVRLTRLSRGLSSGYIEYADNITILNAIKERKEY